MKKIIYFFCISLFYLLVLKGEVQAQVVGEVIDGVPTFTVDIDELIATYNANLLEVSGIDGEFNAAELKIYDEGGYLLIFSGPDYKSVFLASNEDNQVMVAGGTSCTTSDCASESTGCVPKSFLKGCTPCNNIGKCTRTTSNMSMIEAW